MNSNNLKYVIPGETIIDDSQGFMAGQGTYSCDNKIISSTFGYVKTIDKLINVVSSKIYYKPDQGDVFIGRITTIEKGLWKVNVNSKREGVLNIVNINLPKGEQRKRNQDDTLNMKNFFKENDLLSGEILSYNHDGAIHLQTRNMKYGKLKNGMLVKVNANLVKKMKSHFVNLMNGIKIIFGKNGNIFVYYSSKELTKDMLNSQENYDVIDENEIIPVESMMLIILTKNLIEQLDSNQVIIDLNIIMRLLVEYLAEKSIFTKYVNEILQKVHLMTNESKSKDFLSSNESEITIDDINKSTLKANLIIDEEELKKMLNKISINVNKS